MKPGEETALIVYGSDKTIRAVCVLPAVVKIRMGIFDKGKGLVLLKILWKPIIVCYSTGGVGNCPRVKCTCLKALY
ncbi:MAG: hypothetical protein BWY65_01051 [Firmicutes bacterium ADurb.Bin373]|nr:MAG: hypothetical protein BWY65_01051 [Firmicutes bacterium ADurb.Bin373]